MKNTLGTTRIGTNTVCNTCGTRLCPHTTHLITTLTTTLATPPVERKILTQLIADLRTYATNDYGHRAQTARTLADQAEHQLSNALNHTND